MISVDKGFHSLIQVLLEGGFEISERAFSLAVWRRRLDIDELFFRFGAPVDLIPFSEVVETTDKDMVRFFIEKGADFKTGWPLAIGLKRAPKLFCGIYKRYVGAHPDLKFQAEIALQQLCAENKMRGVCLMLWLGADPRVAVPDFRYSDECDDEELWITSLRTAAWHGHLEIVKKLEPSRELDDLNDLLYQSAYSRNVDLMACLIHCGADPNAAREEGQSLVAHLFHLLDWSLDPCFAFRCSDDRWGSKTKKCLELLIENGLQWEPKDGREFTAIRKPLYRMTPNEMLKWLNLIRRFSKEPEAVLKRILGTPKMKATFREYQEQIKELYLGKLKS